MPKKRRIFPNQITYITNADVDRTAERLGTKEGEDDQWSMLVSYGPEHSKSGYRFGLRQFKGSMVQLSPSGKLTVWFPHFEFLEKELVILRELLVPKLGQELKLSLSEKDGKKLNHSLHGIFWALYPSIFEKKREPTSDRYYAEGSIESQLLLATAPSEASDEVLRLVQIAMNNAWNRGNPSAPYFLKPIQIRLKDLIAEAEWARERGHSLTQTDIEILKKSGRFTSSDLLEHNQMKQEKTKSLSYEELKALIDSELRERLDWLRRNQPWRIGALLDGGFITCEQC
jgi:hypothetical protein